MKKKQDELLNSNYDGIQEYDNDLPRWWVYLFYITIAFAAVYCGYFFLGFRKNTTDEILTAQLQAIEASKPVVAAGKTEEQLLSLSSDAAVIAKGKAVFDLKCMPCHGDKGQGLVGPNLTDDSWIHGGKLTEIHKTIEVGVPAKGMLAWKGIIPEEEIDAVTVFIHSLQGSNPPNPKAPEGQKLSDGK